MEWQFQWVDVRPYLAQGVQPVFMLERPLLHGHAAKGGVFGVAEVARTGTYWVPEDDPLTTDGHWAVTKAGAHVRVPVLAYRTPERALASIWGLGVQLGAAAVASLARRTPARVLAAHLILGHECSDLTPHASAFRCYVGLAIQVETDR